MGDPRPLAPLLPYGTREAARREAARREATKGAAMAAGRMRSRAAARRG